MIRNEKNSITNYFQDATAKRLDQYWVSVDDIEKMTGKNVPVATISSMLRLADGSAIDMDCS